MVRTEGWNRVWWFFFFFFNETHAKDLRYLLMNRYAAFLYCHRLVQIVTLISLKERVFFKVVNLILNVSRKCMGSYSAILLTVSISIVCTLWT